MQVGGIREQGNGRGTRNTSNQIEQNQVAEFESENGMKPHDLEVGGWTKGNIGLRILQRYANLRLPHDKT